jgi:hypothetical protein
MPVGVIPFRKWGTGLWRGLRRWLGYDEEPLVELVGGLSDPEAEMSVEALRREGIAALIKSANPLIGEFGTRAVGMDYALFVRAGDAARARDILSPLLETHADPSRQPRRLRRRRGK